MALAGAVPAAILRNVPGRLDARRRASLLPFLVLLPFVIGCAAPLVPTASPAASGPVTVTLTVTETAAPNVECVDLPQAQPHTCDTVMAAVRVAHTQEADDASRVLVATTCPPQVGCEGTYFYDLIVLLIPAAGPGSATALHVFGHLGLSLQVEPWTGALPTHVADLLSQGN